MTPSVLRDSLRLARTDGIGPVAFRRLLARYRTAAAAIDALPGLARAGGRAVPPAVPSAAVAAREIAALEKLQGQFLIHGQPGYPALLALLDDAPPIIAVLGDPACLAQKCVALVGSRNASVNGQRMAENLARELAEAGFTVVSGMARGVDGAAHEGALRTGKTVAAVAGGIDLPYPPEHADLQRRIAASGAVVAEAPLGTAPLARHFPRRNRIIAGLSLGVVVVEAALRSGSLITARIAIETGREVFAVPGSPLDPRARGANDLIREGAHLTETLADILNNLPDHPTRVGLARNPLFSRGEPPGLGEPAPASPDQAATDAETTHARDKILAMLSPAPTDVDDLIRRCQFSAPAVMAALLDLEIAGRVESLPGNRVARLV